MKNYFFKDLPDFSNFNTFAKNDVFFNTAINATKELVDLNAKFANAVLNSGVDFADFYVESSEKQYKATADVKDINDYTAKQTAFVEEYSSKLAEVAESNIKMVQDASEEYAAWFKKNFEAAEVVAKEAAEEVTKAAKPVAAKRTTKKAA